MRILSAGRRVFLFATGCLALCGALRAQTQGAGTDVTGPERQPLTEPGYYTLHPGDTIDVTFRFTPEFNDEVVIGPDGRAALKSTGDILLAGRTIPEAEREIVVNSSAKLVNPDVAITLKDFERPSVVVAGEVQTPAKFELRKPTTALQAILMAGGPKEDSAMGHVYLFRRINSDTAEVHVLQLGRYDGATRAKNDLLLQPGDMILVKRDALEKIGRFIKTFNLGVYFNPIGNNGIF
jgi:polysaccharide export outer membrane protein